MIDVKALATATAREMGDGWQAAPAANPAGALLCHEDGRCVFMWKPPGQHNRLQIQGSYPDGFRGPWLFYRDQPMITVREDRPARAVASEIRRRLLPEYEPMLERARADVAEDARLRERREQVAARILAAVPGSSREACQPRDDEINIRLPGFGHGSYGNRIRILRDGEVDLQMRSMDPLVAVRLATAMGPGDGPAAAMPAAGRESVRPREAQTWLRRAVRPALPEAGRRRPGRAGDGTAEPGIGRLF